MMYGQKEPLCLQQPFILTSRHFLILRNPLHILCSQKEGTISILQLHIGQPFAVCTFWQREFVEVLNYFPSQVFLVPKQWITQANHSFFRCNGLMKGVIWGTIRHGIFLCIASFNFFIIQHDSQGLLTRGDHWMKIVEQHAIKNRVQYIHCR